MSQPCNATNELKKSLSTYITSNYYFRNHWPSRLLIKLKTFCSLSIFIGYHISGGYLSDLVSAEMVLSKSSCQPQKVVLPGSLLGCACTAKEAYDFHL